VRAQFRQAAASNQVFVSRTKPDWGRVPMHTKLQFFTNSWFHMVLGAGALQLACYTCLASPLTFRTSALFQAAEATGAFIVM
jgi:hypothetical protein